MKKETLMKALKIFCLLVCIVAICLVLVVKHRFNMITTPQDDYAKYLVDVNNDFVKSMYDFLIDIEKVRTIEEGEEKSNLLKVVNKYILDQDDIAKKMRENSPNIDNADYYDIGNQMNQTYLFMIQGEIGILEQMYFQEEDRDDSVLKTNYAMQNVMGEIILQFPTLINQVRDTDYKPNYTYIPDDDSITVTGVKSDKEYSQYLDKLNQEMNGLDNENSNSPIKDVNIEDGGVKE